MQRPSVESEAQTETLLSAPGMVAGTMPYMSPEQVRGETIDGRSDIFRPASPGTIIVSLPEGEIKFGLR